MDLDAARTITSHPIALTNLHFCVDTYIGESNRILRSKVMEIVPRWLQNQFMSNVPVNVVSRKQCSSLQKYTIETALRIYINTAFV